MPEFTGEITLIQAFQLGSWLTAASLAGVGILAVRVVTWVVERVRGMF